MEVGAAEQVFDTVEEGYVVIIERGTTGYRCAIVRHRDGVWKKRLSREVNLNASRMARMLRDRQYKFVADLRTGAF
jgi:hypothetical protein